MKIKVRKKAIYLLCLIMAVCILFIQLSFKKPYKKPNVLFIFIDDLRPNLGCYNDSRAITPNIDNLAQRSTVFKYAYCQQSVCNPSRASIMTGLRPDEAGVTDLETHFRSKLPDAVTLPQLFTRNGYEAVAIGKIFHGEKHTLDPVSWTKPPIYSLSIKEDEYALPGNKAGGKSATYECVDTSDEAYEDGRITLETIKQLKEFKKSGQSFFLAVGFKKPHLPFCAPEKYWELYKDASFKTGLNEQRPLNAPELAFHNSQELRGYKDIPKQGKIDDTKIAILRQGYYACISYVDAQIGIIMKNLGELGLSENTVIVLVGDNGFHLGEQDLWAKSTNFELDTRVPLIISFPGKSPKGATTNALVEGVDIYPTVAEMCNIQPVNKLSGRSLLPVIMDPAKEFKQAVFSQFVRPYGALRKTPATHMGYSVRTKDWRYTAWFNMQNNAVEYTELYNLVNKGQEVENYSGIESYKEIEAKLKMLVLDYKDRGGGAIQPVTR